MSPIYWLVWSGLVFSQRGLGGVSIKWSTYNTSGTRDNISSSCGRSNVPSRDDRLLPPSDRRRIADAVTQNAFALPYLPSLCSSMERKLCQRQERLVQCWSGLEYSDCSAIAVLGGGPQITLNPPSALSHAQPTTSLAVTGSEPKMSYINALESCAINHGANDLPRTPLV